MTDQPSLPDFDESAERGPTRLGRAQISYRDASSILTRATGFMAAYDYTLNPYSGCAFGCSYCYAAFFSRSEELRDSWGEWVQVKGNALTKLRRMRTPLEGKSIYMSSVTDPYQPIEGRLGLVRQILEELVHRRPRLVVQTRSPLVVRDLDLFKQLEHVRVNLTVTTDSEVVRKAFEPYCPSNEARLKAAAELTSKGVETAITLTPLLPIENPTAFARRLRETGVTRFVVQPFHPERGRFVAGTRDEALATVKDMDWTAEKYGQALAAMRSALPSLIEGRDGFAPI